MEAALNKMKVEFDLMTTKIADVTRQSDETSQLNFKISKEMEELKHNYQESKQEASELK